MVALSVVDNSNFIVNSFNNAGNIQIVTSLPNVLKDVSLL